MLNKSNKYYNRSRQIPRALVLCLAALFFCGTTPFVPQPVAHAQDKSLVWERFDVDITVNIDGTVDVTEHQMIRFTSGTFSKGARDIPRRNFSRLDNWSLVFSVQERGTEYRIAWYFPDIANAAEGYSISYTVHDALRFYEGNSEEGVESGDQIWWKAIFGDRPFPVLDGVVTVRVPEQAEIQQWAAYVNETNAKNLGILAEVRDDGHEIVYTLSNRLRAGEELEVRVEFTGGVVDGQVQSWQRSADAEAAARAEREAYLNGMVGTLLDESVDMQDIIATLVDLAQRKAISITQDTRAEWFTTSTDFIYKLERDDVPMRDYEKYLLRALFGRKDEVRLSSIKNKFYDKLPGIKEELCWHGSNRLWFDDSRSPYAAQDRCRCRICRALGSVPQLFEQY